MAKAIEERILKSPVQFGFFYLEESSSFPELESEIIVEKLLASKDSRIVVVE